MKSLVHTSFLFSHQRKWTHHISFLQMDVAGGQLLSRTRVWAINTERGGLKITRSVFGFWFAKDRH